MTDTNRELGAFWSQFHVLLESGISVLESLEVLQAETAAPELHEAIDTLAAVIRTGGTLSEAAAKYPALFSEPVITLIRTGELKGNIDVIFGEIAKRYPAGAVEPAAAAVHQTMTGFWHTFHSLIASGTPLVKALETAGGEVKDKELKKAVSAVNKAAATGQSLAAVMARHPLYFPPAVVCLVRVGEKAGVLDKMAGRIAECLADGTFVAGRELPAPAADSTPEPIGPDEAAVVKTLNLLLLDAIKNRASDIHIDPTASGLRLRVRIDGALKEITPPGRELAAGLVTRIKIMANMDVSEKRKPQDGRVMLTVDGREIDLRVSTCPAATGEGAVIRILSRETVTLDLEKLNFAPADLARVRRLAGLPNGMVIVTGPTGSGKTTTLYSLLSSLNREEVKVITAEDPVEYQIDGLMQMPINPAQGITFERAIRSILRQDPDVIMIGEIRNQETAHLLVQVALTGHLVFTTLHTEDSLAAIRRLLDIGLEPFLVNAALAGVVAQRLVRRVCDKCRTPYTPEPWAAALAGNAKDIKFMKGKGCDVCNRTGFRGRIAIYEVLVMDEHLRRIVAAGADPAALRAAAAEGGFTTMKQDGLDKVRQGLTTIEEVLQVVPVG
ncbi:MAG: ATPase, T2SS/T4P/T4SS family [Planctomycetota bacterium]